jgi:ethanolamine utilization protein EutA
MSSNEFKLISAGIDIGTTTTQLIISELILKNRLPGARIPKIEIVKKTILYKSEIYITPIIDHQYVDASAIRRIIKNEYIKAGFSLEEIDTGAIIVTGETAKKENAEKIIHELAGYAGDFVVAVAGPELESILAGKGSGAADTSKNNLETIINLDIGGGTTNISVFEKGQVVEAICVNVGGRLIEIQPESGLITFISKPARVFIDNYGLNIKYGEKADLKNIEMLCEKMVDFVDNIAEGNIVASSMSEILMTSPIKKRYNYDGVMFSGGVAEYIYFKEASGTGNFLFGDMGPILAKAFKKSRLAKNYNLISPEQTIRATVVGAGTQTVNLSGSTIFIKKSILPLRNIPVAKVFWKDFPDDFKKISDVIKDTIKKYRFSENSGPIAISLPCPEDLSFFNIEKMAKGVYSVWKSEMDNNNPLVIILEKDIGKVMGQTLFTISDGKMNFISIDSVSLNDGDYIDIGKPISTDDVVPVIIKTLVFS